jgi:hypothetical protein
VELLSPTLQMIRDDALVEGYVKGIELGLKLRFGAPGVALMTRVRAIEELPALEALFTAVETVLDLPAFAAMLPPQT